MSDQKININKHELQATLDSLMSGIDDFSNYTTSFRSNTREQLKSFNSDFIDKVDALLDNMNNDANTDLIKNMKSIHKAGEELLRSMNEIDEKIGEMIRSGHS